MVLYFIFNNWIIDKDKKYIEKKNWKKIKNNHSSWLVNKALEIANAEQLETLKQNYGKKDDKCVAAVKSNFYLLIN